ncbi:MULTISPECIES: ATP-dependent protease ATPase subunit HslU [Mesotoga]|jgi:ATP-dependent HslUV protease ATP-binding subunit HslU|uniref:ATP-dependent protease ATPase subunit HslU n=1 Tax=Mesotoga TaxID=1184396 RepID=UPI0002C8CDFE|nr:MULTISPECIES: ATP-dependent protease ATPase subunit HslU [Mesotoga]MCP5456425.1 ATP-dependent protease ATPase subunit HslU [Thermotogota bacterium]CCU85689.1 ATP-dependent protease ATPase subunit HslU [Mesotoga infera]MCP5460851.1 ATP-dependent protease ATPase subunit HslU [Thermotogota bacterium]MDK2943445.1 ATP-dependent HslUV protease ATP-binding subunit HslU [Mesotoga sp.]HNQ70246.1 ATP-dependent protease ATPase subunit HslU [Mesotoga prima]
MNREELDELTPKRIVEELNKYIVGQDKAKRAVAVAMRNRIRRQKLPEEIRRDVIPKNILMMGPTGVGKTEIARRLAELTGSPFTKVEATRFTEVGYVGKNVESIIRELVDVGVNMVKQEKMGEVEGKASYQVEERILEALVPGPQTKATGPRNIIELFQGQQQPKPSQEETERIRNRREDYRDRLRSGDLEDLDIEVEVEDHSQQMIMIPGMEDMGIDMSGVLGGMVPKKTKRRKMRIADARKTLLPIEAEKLLDMDKVVAEAIDRVQNRGMVFIDEIDKITFRSGSHGPDVSREGVQRDLLPIIEGTTVTTKYGQIRTDYILFVAAGAFHTAKPSDLIPEFQGRFPIRVELDALSQKEFLRILVEPKNAITKQYMALLETEGVKVTFTEDGLKEIARVSHSLNEKIENIGARRLYTVVEKVLEEVSFNAPEVPQEIVVDVNYVNERIGEIAADEDLSAFIL